MNSNIKSVKKSLSFNISVKAVSAVAYTYILIPIIIFFVGWVKPIISIPSIIIILFGLYTLIKNSYNSNETISIDLFSSLLIMSLTFIWVYSAGIGGFWPQMPDWHWRNAVFHDLIDYSWPVVYPATDNALVYYFNFFLPAALIGKITNWNFANTFLLIQTCIGICISMLLIIDLLKLNTRKLVLIMLVVFITWSGLEKLREPLLNLPVLKGVIGYQFSSNNTLLQWVTNQTIVPWIAVPLYLKSRKIRSFIFLGACTFASAPFPFIGLCILMLIDGVHQFFKQYNTDIKEWFKNVFSYENLSALLTIFPVYILFFICNSAAIGATGEGGFGLYVPFHSFSTRNALSLLTFLLYNFAIFSILIYREHKKDILFWAVNFSLTLIPLFKVGTGNDFGMRACIPAQFVQMIMIIAFLRKEHGKEKMHIYRVFVIGAIALNTCFFANYYINLFEAKVTTSSTSFVADGIQTFSNKTNNGFYCGMKPFNFLCSSPEETIFFTYVSKDKSNSASVNDNALSQSKMSALGFEYCSGQYYISPLNNPDLFLSCKDGQAILTETPSTVMISDSTVNGKYEIMFPKEKSVLEIDSSDNSLIILEEDHALVWGIPTASENRLFDITMHGNSNTITWQNYSFSFIGTDVKLCASNSTESSLWMIRTTY